MACSLFAFDGEKIVPDAISTAVFMVVVLFIIALAIGNNLAATVDAWYRGLWMLLPFTMQMTLVLVLGSVLAATPLFRKMIISISRKPRTATQVIIYSAIVVAVVSYLNWGLALALGPLIAIHFAGEAEKKGIAIDFPFLLAVNGGAGSVWQFGLSASAPLLMATPGHFLEADAGTMSLSSTIWSPAAIFLVIGFPIVVIIAACLLMPRNPKPLLRFPAASRLAEPIKDTEGEDGAEISFSDRMERNSLMPITLGAALLVWLYYHFLIKRASLDLNSLNTIFLLLCVVFHGNISQLFARVAKGGRCLLADTGALSPVRWHRGLNPIHDSGRGFQQSFCAALKRVDLSAAYGIRGNGGRDLVPSSGGQWVIQGFVTLKAAEAVGVTAQRGLLALGVGDQMGNLVSPFWFVVRAEIAQIDFRTFFGYGLIFALLWFVFGVAAFTFLPC